MGRCRYCSCTEYRCDFWQVCANGVFKTFNDYPIGVYKAIGGNPQPNQNIKPCVCGHLKNNHY